MNHLHHKVSALVDGELSGSAKKRALAHARRCATCREEIVQTLAIKHRLLGLAPVEPSADLFATLGSVRPAPDRAQPPRRTHVLRRVLVGAGSMSAAVLTLAYVVGAPDTEPEPLVAPPVGEFSAEFAGAAGNVALSDPDVSALASTYQPVSTGDVTPAAAPDGSYLDSFDVLARSFPEVGAGASDNPVAVSLLRRAMMAPARVAYQGSREITTVETESTATISLDVHHVPGQGTSYRVEGGGVARSTATFVAQRETAGGGFAGQSLRLLVDGYDIHLAGSDQVAGRPTAKVTAHRAGEEQATFWIDDATGLLVRREVLFEGQPVRTSTFTELTTARRDFLQHLPPELEDPATTALSMQAAPALNDEGWTCPDDLAGSFELTFLNRVDAGGDVMHAGYSDGLSTVSIFEEQGTLDESGLLGFEQEVVDGELVFVRSGLPSVAVWESDGTVFTVVTDAPEDTAEDLIAALPHEVPEEQGTSSRLGDGLTKIGSFVNPMG